MTERHASLCPIILVRRHEDLPALLSGIIAYDRGPAQHIDAGHRRCDSRIRVCLYPSVEDGNGAFTVISSITC